MAHIYNIIITNSFYGLFKIIEKVCIVIQQISLSCCCCLIRTIEELKLYIWLVQYNKIAAVFSRLKSLYSVELNVFKSIKNNVSLKEKRRQYSPTSYIFYFFNYRTTRFSFNSDKFKFNTTVLYEYSNEYMPLM